MSDQNSKGLASSAEDSRAKTSPERVGVPGLEGQNQVYGRSLPGLLAYYDLVTFSWRTPRAYLNTEAPLFSGTLPRSGMMLSGTLYPLPTLAPRISAIGSSYWPTPLADDAGHRKRPYSQGGRALSYVAGGYLNPNWVEWLMGFPVGWTELADEE